MGRVIIDISMSLDGYMTAAGQTAEEPMGIGGLRLHEWAFDGDERDRAQLEHGGARLGAVICGRRTYDHSIPWWHADGPTASLRVPVLVVSHSQPERLPENGVYTFVNDLDAAISAAQEIAGERDITVMGGANLIQQVLRAGLADEVSIHLVPVLFGDGTPLFAGSGGGFNAQHLNLQPINAVQTNAAVHLRFAILGPITPTAASASEA